MINNGVPAEQAGTACSDALIPKELSECVSIIKNRTQIAGIDALRGCYQVRRPVDLGNCVADIVAQTPTTAATSDDKNTEINPQLAVLDSCRASLLPGRYSECVTALNRQVSGITLGGALDTCLSAEAFPADLYPPTPAK
jgi:hypothetical protein